MMNQYQILLVLSVYLLILHDNCNGFTFMKNWKIPGMGSKQKNQALLVKEKFGDKKLAVITDTSSPLGKKTAQKLINTGEYFVIGGVPSLKDNLQHDKNFTPIQCDLNSFESVREFCKNVEEYRLTKPIDRLICCNAGLSVDKVEPQWSKDGHEEIMQKNYLSYFLVISKLLDSMVDSRDGRVALVSGPHVNDPSSSGRISPDLLDMKGFEAGFQKPIAMADSSDESSFNIRKAIENSSLCQKMLTNFLHTKYHKLTDIAFNDLEVDTDEELQQKGLFELIHGPRSGSGVTVTFDGESIVEPDEELDYLRKEYDFDAAYKLNKYSSDITDSTCPKIKQFTSPCPTLKVIGAITKGSVRREELKRMRELGRPGIEEPEVVKMTKRKKVAAFVDKAVTFTLKQTVGRVARIASSAILGQIPETATTGSFDELPEEAIKEVQDTIAAQVFNQEEKADAKDKFGDRKLVVLTGASSGLGRKTALALLRSNKFHVIGAVRDLDKMEVVAEVDGFDMEHFTPMYCELNSFESVRAFCKNVDKFRGSKPLDRLICNAGVYQPSLRHAKYSIDGHEQTMQINFLSHFLMISLLMKSMGKSEDPRITMVGSVTGNDNTVGGGGVYPIADLHDLDGFSAGFKKPIEMADGYGFIGAKAYKDSKLCLMILSNYLHTMYNKLTGITFSSMYPGCIAESPLFREKRPWFRKFFPVFMRYITGGFVGEEEAGQRLYQVAIDKRCAKSGVYWSWNGGPREGRGLEALEKGGQISGGGGAGGGWDSIFEEQQSSKVLDIDTAQKLFTSATKITGAEWIDPKDFVEMESENLILEDAVTVNGGNITLPSV